MDRHFGTARLASGILFSPPADLNAKPDVWNPKRKKKFQNMGQSLMSFSADSHDDSSGSMMEDIQGSNYAVFPQFINIATLKPLTRQISSRNGSKLSLSYLHSSESPVTMCLPILRVSVDVSIDGTIARTNVTQSFHNPSDMNIPEARHTFPLYYSAVVTSFECKVGDSRRLRGVVKPTAQARQEFEESKKKRKTAALLEELTPEIFETSLGSIPANTTVEICLTYVHQLKVVTSKEEKSEGLAVIIPASAAPRYAAAVTPAPTSEVPSDQLEIAIRVFDDGSINPAGSHVESNHPSTTYHGLQPSSNLLIANIAELHNFNLATSSVQKMEHVWKYSCESQPILNGDFVFVIQMLGETRLQSHAVITPINDMGHAALMVHLRPNDLFGSAIRPELFKGEILFVLDRSSSMSWTQSGTDRLKIETMRNAMSLALSGLPWACKFNIISFGSEVRGMWNRSQRADEPKNLSYAREYVANVEADMGGTELLLALKGAVNNHNPECSSTQVILITDGEIDREPHSSILKHVWETRKRYGEKIRFFTLGIGDSVSHSVLESVAELGGGYCDVVDVVKKPRWEGCLNRMLRSVMEPDAWTCDIDLGPGYKRQSLATERFGMNDGDDASFILYAQGPHPIPSLEPFRYKSFFFLLNLGIADLPQTVTIRTTAAAAKKKTYTMAVKPTQSRADTIHTLAVKMILRSFEAEVKRPGASEEQARLNAEYLGTKYTISSNWTSFVAVADERLEQTYHIDTYKSLFREADIAELQAPVSRNIPRSYFSPVSAMIQGNIMQVCGSLSTPKDACVEECLAWDTEISINMSNELPKKDINDGNRSEAHKSNIDNTPSGDEVSIPKVIEESPDEYIIEGEYMFEDDNQNTSQPPHPCNDDTVADQSHASLQIVHSAVCAYRSARENAMVNHIMHSMVRHPGSSGHFDLVRWHRMSTSANEESTHEDVLFYQPSDDGTIAWQDAAGCESGGVFILPAIVRQRLRQHFCDVTAEHLQETLRGSSGAKVAEEEEAVLIDTLMMIQYFKTHLATEEDYWSLLMDKAERALLLALGYDEDQNEALESLYKMLSSSILHVHFSESLKRASVYHEETDKSLVASLFETCLVCSSPIETDDKKRPIINKGYTCLADECYDGKAQGRKVYANWKTFWDHQVHSGHLLCP